MRTLSSALFVIGMTALAATTAVVGAFHISGAKLNQSRSLPRGIYVPAAGPIERGAVVFFRLPETLASYVSTFPGGAEFYATSWNGILKPVAGVGGDVICRDSDVFSVNGKALGVALRAGPNGGALPTWAGCTVLGEGEIAVYSDRIAGSLDSRYFGAIPAARAAPYRPLLTLRE